MDIATADGDPISVRLDELRGNRTEPERALVNRVIASFRVRAPRYFATLAAAVTAADAVTLEDEAHSFKGAASNIGAAGLAEICRRLEAHGGTGQLDPGDPAVADDLRRLRTEVGSVDTQLQAILDREPPEPG